MSDRQQANAALAVLAKAGNAYALGQLWEMNQGFINSQLWKWYTGHREVCDAAAITYEDLQQEGFFAVQNAAAAYDPEKGAFTTCLGYQLQNVTRKLLLGAHVRMVECSDGVIRQVGAEPMNGAVALDEQLPSDDDSERTRMDLLPDPTAQAAFDAVDNASEADELRSVVNAALGRLNPRAADVIRNRFMEPEPVPYQKISQALGVTPSQARNLEANAFRKLYRDKNIVRLHDQIIGQNLYSGVGFGAWKYNGSVQERTIERLERRNAFWSAGENSGKQ